MDRQPTPVCSGELAAYNITADAVVKAAFGRVVRISVVTAGSASSAVHDCAAVGDAAASNKIATVPTTAGTVMHLDWPCATGIVIKIGSGQVLAVSYV